MQEKIGLWGGNEVDKNNVNIENSSSIQQTTSNSNDDCADFGCPEGTMFVGSKNSDKYHKCSCSYASKIKKENIVCFSSVQEAENQGYKQSSCG